MSALVIVLSTLFAAGALGGLPMILLALWLLAGFVIAVYLQTMWWR